MKTTKIKVYLFFDLFLSHDREDRSHVYYDDVYLDLDRAKAENLIIKTLEYDNVDVFKEKSAAIYDVCDGGTIAVFQGDKLIFGGTCDETFLEIFDNDKQRGDKVNSLYNELYSFVEQHDGCVTITRPVRVTTDGDEPRRNISVHALCIKSDFMNEDRPVLSLQMIDSNFFFWNVGEYCGNSAKMLQRLLDWATNKNNN